ncbi:hypothetical protein [Methanobrevibacter sp. DSM 116169]|uniref:hypothetical protein n=1 Tax=Methanobrevibacter sp. DSM 116169 TaxID=3242727 RepID=UPI0038FBFF73
MTKHRTIAKRETMKLRNEKAREYYYQNGIEKTAIKYNLPIHIIKTALETYTSKTNDTQNNIVLTQPSYLPYAHEFEFYWNLMLNNYSYADDFYIIANSYPYSSLAVQNLFKKVFNFENPSLIAKKITFIKNYNKRKFGLNRLTLDEIEKYSQISMSDGDIINTLNSTSSLNESCACLNVSLTYLIHECMKRNILRSNKNNEIIAEHENYLEKDSIYEVISSIDENFYLIKDEPKEYEKKYFSRINTS